MSLRGQQPQRLLRLDCFRRLFNQRGHGLWLRNIDGMTTRHLNGGCTGPLGHKALRRGWDHFVIGGHQVPAWLALPSWCADGPTQRPDTPRQLRIRHELRFVGIDIGRKGGMKLGLIQQEKAILRGQNWWYRPCHQLTGNEGMITGLAWSPDGTLLGASASGKEHGEILIWDPNRGEHQYTLGGDKGTIHALAWGASNAVLVSGGDDGNLRWWDMAQGMCVRVRLAHEGAVQALRRTTDGTTLASCGDDGAIMLWDLDSGSHRQTLRRDRPYERLDITGLLGITDAQRTSLLALGAIVQID